MVSEHMTVFADALMKQIGVRRGCLGIWSSKGVMHDEYRHS